MELTRRGFGLGSVMMAIAAPAAMASADNLKMEPRNWIDPWCRLCSEITEIINDSPNGTEGYFINHESLRNVLDSAVSIGLIKANWTIYCSSRVYQIPAVWAVPLVGSHHGVTWIRRGEEDAFLERQKDDIKIKRYTRNV